MRLVYIFALAMSSDNYYLYIVTNKHKNVLYIGMTNSLRRRLFEHKNEPKGFVKRYNCHFLLYFEIFKTPSEAILREKEIKRWSRIKKDNLIKVYNPDLEFKDDLFL